MYNTNVGSEFSSPRCGLSVSTSSRDRNRIFINRCGYLDLRGYTEFNTKKIRYNICTKVLTALCDGSAGGQVTVFTVHVDGSTTGHITQPDGKVLDPGRAFVMYLKGKVVSLSIGLGSLGLSDWIINLAFRPCFSVDCLMIMME